MPKFYGWLINKLRTARYSVGNSGITAKMYTFGTIVEGEYTNYKHDRTPLAWIQYSDPSITHAINLHYLDRGELAWFGRNLYMIRKYQQAIDGRTFYAFLKQQKPNIIKKAYRTYHTNLCKYRLVSAGITNMDDLCYTTRNPFINELNRTLAPTELGRTPQQVAYSTTELRERIVEAQNSRPIQQRPSSFGNAPWMRK